MSASRCPSGRYFTASRIVTPQARCVRGASHAYTTSGRRFEVSRSTQPIALRRAIPLSTSSVLPPGGKGTVTPYIVVKGADRFLEFVSQAFAAEELGRTPNPDGTIGHAEVRIGASVLMVFDARPEWADTPSFLCIYVDDADATFARAVEAGATPITAMTTFGIIGDRVGRVRDPLGNVWWSRRTSKMSPRRARNAWPIQRSWQS